MSVTQQCFRVTPLGTLRSKQESFIHVKIASQNTKGCFIINVLERDVTPVVYLYSLFCRVHVVFALVFLEHQKNICAT